MAVKHLHLDFETRSKLDIKKVGLDRYARDAQVLMLAWAFDDEEPQLWLPKDEMAPHLYSLPYELHMALHDDAVVKAAWNAAFERAIFQHCLGLYIPPREWFDPSVMARYATLPNSLEPCSHYLKLGELAKDKEGKRLINLFSKPYRGKFRKPEDQPEDWEKFKAYCLQDVRAERAAMKKLAPAFTLTPFEQRVFEIDQEINDRGIPVDLQFVREAKTLVEAEKFRLKLALAKRTGLANPNSGSQMLPWLRSRGYPYASLLKKRVDQALQSPELSEEVREVLLLRGKLSRSSTSKLDAILDRVGPDGMLRHSYKFLGANRTGRWAGQGAQLQNLPR